MSNNNGKKSTSFGEWTLKDLLMWMKENSAKFYIPDYQRGYAWGERQLTDFWDDLLSPTKKHYTGAITVEEVQDNFSGHYDVVDGQQRLTTIAVLFSILNKDSLLCSRLMYGENNESREYFIELLRSNAFNSRAVENGKFEYLAPDTLKNPKNVYQRNLIKAKVFFLKKTSEMGEKEKCDLFDKTLAKLTFDFRILGGDFNSGIVFETMNNRGKPLTLLEKLKNRLIYLSDNLSNPNDKNGGSEPLGPSNLRDAINTAWGKIYKELASDPKREPLDEDEFVASHLSVYRNPKESVYSESVAESRLFKMFCAHPERYPKSEDVDEENKVELAKAKKDGIMEGVLTSQKICEYVEDLMEFASAWATIHKQFDSACGQCRLLSGTREIKVFLAVVALHVKEKEVREAIYEKARQILFRNTINAGMDKARFATFARQLHGACINQLKRGSRKKISEKDLLDELDKVLEKKKPTKKKILEFFANRQKGDFYSWSEQGLRYFLMRHENEFNGKADKKPRLTWEMLENTSVEHVLPQSSTNDNSTGWRWWCRVMEDWERQCGLSDGANDHDKVDARGVLVDSLGNLVLLTREENSEVSNRAWESYEGRPGKADFYLDEGKTSSNGAVAIAAEKDSEGNPRSWNAYRIRERGRVLFGKLVEDFGVPKEEFSVQEIDDALGIGRELNGQELRDNTIEKLTPSEVRRNNNEDNLVNLDLDKEQQDCRKRIFLASINEGNKFRQGPSVVLGKRKVLGEKWRKVEFQFFAECSGSLGFQFYSMVDVTPNGNQKAVIGPFLVAKIRGLLEECDVGDIYELEPCEVKNNTEGVVLKLVLRERPIDLCDQVLLNLKKGYEFLKEIWGQINFQTDPLNWNEQNTDQLSEYLTR